MRGGYLMTPGVLSGVPPQVCIKYMPALCLPRKIYFAPGFCAAHRRVYDVIAMSVNNYAGNRWVLLPDEATFRAELARNKAKSQMIALATAQEIQAAHTLQW